MRKIAVFSAAILVLAAALPARAGFRIEEVDLEFPNEVTTSWFQGGMARVDGALEGLTVIVDVRGAEGWLIDRVAKRYAQGKIADLAAELRRHEEAQNDQPEAGGAGDREAPGAPAPPLGVTVKDLGAGERLQGQDTRRYQVLVDGELLEELWLAPKLEVGREVDLAAFASAVMKMLGGGAELGQGYEESEAYRTLRAGGYPLRQVLFFVGEKSTIEVRSIAVQQFSPSDFEVPKGYTRVGYVELLLGESD